MVAGGNTHGAEYIVYSTQLGGFAVDGGVPAPGEIYFGEYGHASVGAFDIVAKTVGGIAGKCHGIALSGG
jgi:hypothetical protein